MAERRAAKARTTREDDMAPRRTPASSSDAQASRKLAAAPSHPHPGMRVRLLTLRPPPLQVPRPRTEARDAPPPLPILSAEPRSRGTRRQPHVESDSQRQVARSLGSAPARRPNLGHAPPRAALDALDHLRAQPSGTGGKTLIMSRHRSPSASRSANPPPPHSLARQHPHLSPHISTSPDMQALATPQVHAPLGISPSRHISARPRSETPPTSAFPPHPPPPPTPATRAQAWGSGSPPRISRHDAYRRVYAQAPPPPRKRALPLQLRSVARGLAPRKRALQLRSLTPRSRTRARPAPPFPSAHASITSLAHASRPAESSSPTRSA
ncbi:hypothetical protein FB451DRAFT_1483652 [Mycena latifolia]|nr:hypothetical protein FB451DRAFT_1483652 [Mycena latifolia]